jgi:type IV pilus assembly protein PilM
MAKTIDSWGVEVGANAIKALRLVRVGNDAPELAEYDVLPFDQILTSPDVDVDAAVREKLELFLSRHDVSDSEVVVSVPGHMAFARFAKLPPVEAKKVPDVVKFEAQQQIPFPIDQVEWDYQVFQQGSDNQLGVGIFAMNKERVGQVLSNYHQFDLRLNALTLSPLAVYNAFQYDNANQQQAGGTMYMDIGSMSTDVIIVENGGIWLRTLPIGGNHFTEALVRAFKLSYPKAEKLKREAGTSKYARQIFQAMRPVFADLVQEVQRSLGYYQSLHRDSNLTRLVGVGSTFRLPGLRKFLKQQLQMEVERPNGFNRISAEGAQASEFSDHAMNMASAYGLALQGLGLETVTANLMPTHTLQARLWQAKQPWFAAAAACLLLAALVAGGRYQMFSMSWDGMRQQSEQAFSQVTGIVNRYQNQWDQIDLQTPRAQINNLRRLLDYRDLWPGLISDVSAANAAVLKATDGATGRMYIQSVNAAYEPAPNASNQPRGRRGQQQNMLGEDVDVERFFSEDGDGPPQLVVTVRGTTSLQNAESVLSKRFNVALGERPEQVGRSYRTVAVNLASLSQPYTPRSQRVGEDEDDASPAGGGPAGAPGAGGPPTGPGPQPQLDDEVGALEQYMPNAPRFDGSKQVQDFTVKWTIELLSPAETRRAEPADDGKDGEDARESARLRGVDAPTPAPTTEEATS